MTKLLSIQQVAYETAVSLNDVATTTTTTTTTTTLPPATTTTTALSYEQEEYYCRHYNALLHNLLSQASQRCTSITSSLSSYNVTPMSSQQSFTMKICMLDRTSIYDSFGLVNLNSQSMTNDPTQQQQSSSSSQHCPTDVNTMLQMIRHSVPILIALKRTDNEHLLLITTTTTTTTTTESQHRLTSLVDNNITPERSILEYHTGIVLYNLATVQFEQYRRQPQNQQQSVVHVHTSPGGLTSLAYQTKLEKAEKLYHIAYSLINGTVSTTDTDTDTDTDSSIPTMDSTKIVVNGNDESISKFEGYQLDLLFLRILILNAIVVIKSLLLQQHQQQQQNNDNVATRLESNNNTMQQQELLYYNNTIQKLIEIIRNVYIIDQFNQHHVQTVRIKQQEQQQQFQKQFTNK
jgi:hypothetical protein